MGIDDSQDRIFSTLKQIRKLNRTLNRFNYGIVCDGKIMQEPDIDWDLYRTLSCSDFLRYRTGTCWDYANYEGHYFAERLKFRIVCSDWLRFGYTFSLYYLEFYEKGETDPTNHTWLSFMLDGRVYSIESSWKSRMGVKEWKSERQMLGGYIRWNEQEYGGRLDRLKVYKYMPLKPGLDVHEFMDGIRKQGHVILG